MSSVRTDLRQGVNSGIAIKVPCRIATTASITLSGLQSIDGITVANGDRVLVKDQASSIDNGIYVANTSAWNRSLDCDGAFDVSRGTLVIVNEGSVNGAKWFTVSSADPITIGSSSISFSAVAGDGTASALSGALAASSGSSLVGFIASGAGAVARDVQSKLRDVVSVKDFGAVGDGSNDDTVEIQAAITAAASIGAGVYFPAGTYKVSAALTLPANAVIFGSGFGSVIKVDSAATRFIVFHVSSTTGINGPTIKDLSIDGSQKGQLDAGLIQLNGALGFSVERVRIFDAGTPGESGSSGVNGIAVAVVALGDVGSFGTIRDCLIEATTKAGINISSESTGVAIDSNTIRNCTGNTQTPGIQIAGGYNARVIGNRVYGCQGSGIYMMTTGGSGTYRHPRYAIIAMNHCHGNGTGSVDGHGIYLGNAAGQSDTFGKIIIANNVCYSNGASYTGGSGIRIETQDDIVLSGNVLYLNKYAGLAVQNCRRVQVVGGLISDNNTGNASDMSGIWIQTSGAAVVQQMAVHGVKFYNTGNQKYPLFFDSSNPADSITNFKFLDNEAVGHEARDFPLTILPKKTELRHAFDYQTTDGNLTNAGYFTLPDESAFRIRTAVLGKKSDASQRAMYDVAALVYRDAAGSATIQGAVQDVHTAVESDANWDASIVVSGNVAAFQILGVAATTVDWRIQVEIISL